jgi:uncharacterized protein YegP (UPF0339 family)
MEDLQVKKQTTFELYKAADGWRWRLVAANGRIIADSGEAYTRRYDAARAITRVRVEANGAPLVDTISGA